MANNRTNKNYIVTELHDQSILVDKREIFLHANPHDECDVDKHSSIVFLKNIRFLDSENNKPIIVHQYGQGGCVDGGMLIYDAIKQCSSPVICIMWGCAYSMSSFIPQAADLRIATQNCSFMIHDGGISLYENTVKQAKSVIEHDKLYRKTMLNVYTNVCLNGPYFKNNNINNAFAIEKFLREQMDKKEDWYLNSKQMLEYGFVDGILGQPEYPSIEEIKKIYDN